MPPRGPLATMSTAAEGQRQYKTRWYGLGGEESPAPPSPRRYHLTGRPCPHDGIIKPTASLEKKLTRLTPKRCRSPFFFSSQFCLLALLSGESCVGWSAFPEGHGVVDDAIGYVARAKKDLRPILATIKVGNKVVFTL